MMMSVRQVQDRDIVSIFSTRQVIVFSYTQLFYAVYNVRPQTDDITSSLFYTRQIWTTRIYQQM